MRAFNKKKKRKHTVKQRYFKIKVEFFGGRSIEMSKFPAYRFTRRVSRFVEECPEYYTYAVYVSANYYKFKHQIIGGHKWES